MNLIRLIMAWLFPVKQQPMPNCGPFRTIDTEKVIQPPKIKQAAFSKRYPMVSKMLKTVGHTALGVLVMMLGIGGLWLAFPGAFKIGHWICVKLGWNVHELEALVRFTVLFMPFAGYQVARLANFFGKSLVKEWEYRRGQCVK
jgi:hypothetical protein